MTRLGIAVRCGCSARDHLDVEYSLSGPGGLLLLPEKEDPRCAVLVMSGSSGRVEVDGGLCCPCAGSVKFTNHR